MKKLYVFIYFMSLILITVITIVLCENVRVNTVNQVSDIPSTFVQENNISTLDNLKFDKGVVINKFVDYDNEYLAVGSKDNYPYMQIINKNDNNLEESDITTSFTKLTGKIVDVTKIKYFLSTSIKNNDQESSQNFFISKDGIIPFYKKQLTMNYSEGVTITPKYIVIHETANHSIGADAEAHYKYWSKNPDAQASTHFVVDSTQIYQMLELNQRGWHVGDNKGYSDITNSNSIGIEIAVNDDGNYTRARQHAIDLTIALMNYLHMDISQLKRHHDASGKNCPTIMLENPELWNDFVSQVKAGLNN